METLDGQWLTFREWSLRSGEADSTLRKRARDRNLPTRKDGTRVEVCVPAMLMSSGVRLNVATIPSAVGQAVVVGTELNYLRQALSAATGQIATRDEQLRQARRELRGKTETIRALGIQLADLRDAMAGMNLMPHHNGPGRAIPRPD